MGLGTQDLSKFIKENTTTQFLAVYDFELLLCRREHCLIQRDLTTQLRRVSWSNYLVFKPNRTWINCEALCSQGLKAQRITRWFLLKMGRYVQNVSRERIFFSNVSRVRRSVAEVKTV